MQTYDYLIYVVCTTSFLGKSKKKPLIQHDLGYQIIIKGNQTNIRCIIQTFYFTLKHLNVCLFINLWI